MAVPLLTLELNLHARTFAFKDEAPKGLDQCLDITERNGG